MEYYLYLCFMDIATNINLEFPDANAFDLRPDGYTLWKVACYVRDLENGEIDEFE